MLGFKLRLTLTNSCYENSSNEAPPVPHSSSHPFFCQLSSCTCISRERLATTTSNSRKTHQVTDASPIPPSSSCLTGRSDKALHSLGPVFLQITSIKHYYLRYSTNRRRLSTIWNKVERTTMGLLPNHLWWPIMFQVCQPPALHRSCKLKASKSFILSFTFHGCSKACKGQHYQHPQPQLVLETQLVQNE